MSRFSTLYNLQEIDIALDQHRQRLDEIAQLLGESEEVRAAQARLDTAEAELSATNHTVRRLSEDAQTTRDKRTQTEQRLYSGNVKNPRTLEDLQQEIEALNRYANTLDDRQLDAMIEVEEAEAPVATARRQLDELTQAWQTNQSDLLAEQQTHQAEVVTLENNRKPAHQRVTPADLPAYDKLRQTKHGRAVARLSLKGLCGACGISVPTAQLQKAQKATELTFCPNCGRIWYVEYA